MHRSISLLLNIAHAIDHLFLLIFATAVAAIAHSAVFYVFRCLLDEQVPATSGLLRPIRVIAPEGLVMFTTFGDDEYVQAALKVGAVGYLLKNRPPIELINSLRAVRDGRPLPFGAVRNRRSMLGRANAADALVLAATRPALGGEVDDHARDAEDHAVARHRVLPRLEPRHAHVGAHEVHVAHAAAVVQRAFSMAGPAGSGDRRRRSSTGGRAGQLQHPSRAARHGQSTGA